MTIQKFSYDKLPFTCYDYTRPDDDFVYFKYLRNANWTKKIDIMKLNYPIQKHLIVFIITLYIVDACKYIAFDPNICKLGYRMSQLIFSPLLFKKSYVLVLENEM